MANRSLNRRPPRGPAVGLEPVPGYYRTRLARGGPELPCVIWFGPLLCPDTGTPLDRVHRLQCRIAGEEHNPHEWWPMHAISREEYEMLLAAMPDDPRRPRDLTAEQPLF